MKPAPSSRRRWPLALATLGAAALGLVVGAAAFLGLMAAEAGLYQPLNPAGGFVGGLLAGAITSTPLALRRKSWPTVALSALGGAVLGALLIVFL